jgi:hypothetical protein
MRHMPSPRAARERAQDVHLARGEPGWSIASAPDGMSRHRGPRDLLVRPFGHTQVSRPTKGRRVAQWSWASIISPGSVVETVRHESHVILRMTSVMTTPMIGSAICTPSATTAALATTPSETNPSMRA